ncbi:hypothetical protein CkaCkLH20_10306 [Colletotrichum karsti]|uniref:Uncharacterized protein n=1 Tax=Colletotrichum karsti TaxID=1095194 RepID=A0A9P6HXH6_9PEZI|nr:uncharacterized protein CkaCkLH20_10306 [Colletotrichum karsti]KAF9872214.1 hypothetical protein CkaCkLH20_10306 [Colletotrichum karsti]
MFQRDRVEDIDDEEAIEASVVVEDGIDVGLVESHSELVVEVDGVDGSEGQASSSSEIGAIASGAGVELEQQWRAWTAAVAAPWEQRPEAGTLTGPR